jgi:hypothetical protein
MECVSLAFSVSVGNAVQVAQEGAGDRPQLYRQHLTARPPATGLAFSYSQPPFVPKKEAGLSLLFALLLIGIPTATLVYDFFTGGEAAMKLGRRNRS